MRLVKPRTDVVIRVSPECKDKLMKLALKRSVELSQRVSMGFVIEELVGTLQQIEHPEQRQATMFGSLD